MTKELIRRAKSDILDDLPELCALDDLTTGETILVRKDECGYWPFPGRDADRYNKRHNITPAQKEAMRVGSMFGFGVPGADPLNHTTG